jgi:hypothetical protein
VAAEFEVVCTGPVAEIRLSPTASAEYQRDTKGNDSVSTKRRVHLQRYFREVCDHNPHRLSIEKFRKEDNFADGRGSEVAVWAFAGRRCFVGVRVDAAKKQDKADQQLLKAAASDISRLREYRPEKVKGAR